MKKNLSLIPFDKIQRAIALAIADVIKRKKTNKILGEFAFATAFYRHYFNTSRPRAIQLSMVSSDLPVREKNRILDQFIRSNGEESFGISPSFANRAFPSFRISSHSRIDNRSNMKCTQRVNVKFKNESRRLLEIRDLKSQMLSLNPTELYEWFNSDAVEQTFTDSELKEALNYWFDLNCDTNNYSFSLLYEGFNFKPSEIMYDLSFGDLYVGHH